MTAITVLRTGPLTTLQDDGRHGMLRHGVSASGPMDRGAFAAAGAALEAAGTTGIEFTQGLSFETDGPIVVACPEIRRLAAGERVEIPPAPGNYGYLRFERELAVAPVLGSTSTNVMVGLGGFKGRALKAGDRLEFGAMGTPIPGAAARSGDGPIRFIWGIHADLFDTALRRRFIETSFRISPRLDRMGVRLDDPAGMFRDQRRLDLVSDFIVPGDLQILGDGTPIVLMRDHQPTGGYPRIATIVDADLDRFAQLRPGTALQFLPGAGMTNIDLNADLGEGVGDDEAMLDIVSSASIACGGHAGDEDSMRALLRAAKARGVVVGAHPSFPDRINFGRARMALPPEELDAAIRAQVRLLVELGEEERWPIRYVKLHGALANMAAEEPAIAALCFAAVEGLVRDMAILAIDNSAQAEVAEALGFRTVREAYADRAYQPNGLLVARQMPGAVLHDKIAIAERAGRLAAKGEIVAIDGGVIRTTARSLCIHGDTPDAVEIARAIKAGLFLAGVEIRAAL